MVSGQGHEEHQTVLWMNGWMDGQIEREREEEEGGRERVMTPPGVTQMSDTHTHTHTHTNTHTHTYAHMYARTQHTHKQRSEEHTSELQSHLTLLCPLLLE